MAKFILPNRVAAAIKALAEWRQRAKSQPAMHLWPLMALIHNGIDKKGLKSFNEPDEYTFWDDYFRTTLNLVSSP